MSPNDFRLRFLNVLNCDIGSAMDRRVKKSYNPLAHLTTLSNVGAQKFVFGIYANAERHHQIEQNNNSQIEQRQFPARRPEHADAITPLCSHGLLLSE